MNDIVENLLGGGTRRIQGNPQHHARFAEFFPAIFPDLTLEKEDGPIVNRTPLRFSSVLTLVAPVLP